MTKQGRRKTTKQKRAEAEVQENYMAMAREIEATFNARREEIVKEAKDKASMVVVKATGRAKKISDKWAEARQAATDKAAEMEKQAKRDCADTIKRAKKKQAADIEKARLFRKQEHDSITRQKSEELAVEEGAIEAGEAEVEAWANAQLAAAEQKRLEDLSVLDAELQLNQ